MAWQLAASYPDYFYQLATLVRDPVYRNPEMVDGRGQPILLIPGFLAGDWTLMRMAGWLNRLGYRAYFSGIDWNVDCPNKTSEKLRWRLDHIANETSEPLIVIGHSLGGLLARFLGANFSDRVCHVIALGAPLNVNDPESVHPLVRSAFQLLTPLRRLRGGVDPQCGSTACSCRFARTAFSTLPIAVRSTSIFSKSDEIVDWRSAIDPNGENFEVSGRHLGLIVNREVYQVIAQVLNAYTVINRPISSLLGNKMVSR